VVSELLSGGETYQQYEMTEVNFHQPLKFYRDEPRRVFWKVQVTRCHDTLVAHVRMQSMLSTRLGETKVLEHFSGKVHFCSQAKNRQPQSEHLIAPTLNGSAKVDAKDIYQLYFHGPAFQVLKGVRHHGDFLLGQCQFEMLDEVERLLNAASYPLLVESCFQTAGVWEIGHDGRFSLPQSIGRLSLYPTNIIGHAIFACVKPRNDQQGKLTFDAWVVDDRGQICLEMQDYQTSPLVADLEEESLEPFRAIVEDVLD